MTNHQPSRRTLVRGGHVYRPGLPEASAMLVSGERITWIGTESDAAEHAAALRADDELVELDGALVTPAFVDAHVHTTMAGLALTGLDLAGSASRDDALRRLAAHAEALPGDTVVLGHGWDETNWQDQRPFTVAELDHAAGGRPVFLSRVDAHSAVVSSAARALDPRLPTLPGYSTEGPLTREANHAARHVAMAGVPAAQRAHAQRTLRAHAAATGIAALHECGGPAASGEDDLSALLALAGQEPGPDVYGYWAELGAPGKARELGAVAAGGDLSVDGALGSRTARLNQPYLDAPHTHGNAYLTPRQIGQHVSDCVREGVQCGFHAIGDEALETVVTGLRHAHDTLSATLGQARALRAIRTNGVRVEHAEMASPRHITALASYGVTASVQPAFDAAWGGRDGMYARRLGIDRALAMNPFAALRDAGVPLAFGSDTPVTPLDPWGALRAAVHHHAPAHRLDPHTAFAAHTSGGWRALGPLAGTAARDETGTLRPGGYATYAVWRVDALTAGLPDLAPGRPLPACLRTAVRGTVIHDTPGLATTGSRGPALATATSSPQKGDRP